MRIIKTDRTAPTITKRGGPSRQGQKSIQQGIKTRKRRKRNRIAAKSRRLNRKRRCG